MQEGLTARSAMVADGGRKIATLLNDSHEKLKVGRASPEWRAYSDWVASIVIDGLRAATVAGVRFMVSQVHHVCNACSGCMSRMSSWGVGGHLKASNMALWCRSI